MTTVGNVMELSAGEGISGAVRIRKIHIVETGGTDQGFHLEVGATADGGGISVAKGTVNADDTIAINFYGGRGVEVQDFWVNSTDTDANARVVLFT